MLTEACCYYNIDEFYDAFKDNVLGKSDRSVVYQGINKNQKFLVAIKQIKSLEVKTEIQIMKLGVHHYVGRLLDYFTD